jgi:WD40 repeat protein
MSVIREPDPNSAGSLESPRGRPTSNRNSRRVVGWHVALLLLAIPILTTATYFVFIKFVHKPPDTPPLRPYTEITSLKISADGSRLAAVGFTNGPPRKSSEPRYSSVRVWDLAGGVPKDPREYRPRDGEFDTGHTSIALSPDGKTLAALGTMDSTGSRVKGIVVFWSVESKEVLAQAELTLHEQWAPGKTGYGPGGFTFTKDGKSVVFVTDLGVFQVNVKDANGTQTPLADVPVYHAEFVPSTDQFVELRKSKADKLNWTTEVIYRKLGDENEPTIVPLGRFPAPFNDSLISGDGKTLAVHHLQYSQQAGKSVYNTGIAIFEAETGKRLTSVVNNQDLRFLNVPAKALTHDGKLLGVVWELADKKSYSAAIYQTSDGKRLHESVHEYDPKNDRHYSHLAFMPDGSALFYIRQPNTIVRMGAKTGEETEY